MTLARAQVDDAMVRRMGRMLSWWGLDGTTDDGTNPDVGAALGRALIGLDATPSSLSDPVDADLAATDTPAASARLLDLVHLHLLEACYDNADEVSEREGVNEQRWNERIAELRQRINQARAALAAAHGDGLGVVSGGTLSVAWLTPEPDDALGDDD